jgi:hypothetical protein
MGKKKEQPQKKPSIIDKLKFMQKSKSIVKN